MTRPGKFAAVLAIQVLCSCSQSSAPGPQMSTNGPGGDPGQGVELLDAAGTLRKASLQIAGRVPTAAELQAAGDGGLDALDPLLSSMMTEDAFYERLREIFNDVLLTDAYRYEQNFDSIVQGPVDHMLFPNRVWYGSNNSVDAKLSADALAREPLEMVVHVVKNDRPLTEIVTGRYRLLNPYSAKVFGLSLPFKDDTDPTEFIEAQIPLVHDGEQGVSEYAGILTTTSFLYRYPNTGTNRNRKRARYFYKYFLNFDIMKTAKRLDLSQVDFSTYPWRYNGSCTVCHGAIDPVAGAFLNWTDCYDGAPARYFKTEERYCGRGPMNWFPPDQVFPPGTGGGSANQIPAAQLPTALQTLAATVVGNRGFADAMTSDLLVGLTGWPVLDMPIDPMAPDYASLSAAYNAQQALIGSLSDRFVQDGYNVKKLIVNIVESPAFRAANADRTGRTELTAMGGGVLSPPEVLHRKIASVMGAPWGAQGAAGYQGAGNPYYLLATDKLRIPYGGIDSENVLTRQKLPSALSAAASQRMAFEMSCEYAAVDFVSPKAARLLFPLVERTQVPSGDPGAAGDQAIVKNLQYLHQRVLGEELAADSPELRETYDLLYAAYKDGISSIGKGLAPAALVQPCQGTRNFFTGQQVAGGFTDDANYMVRAWQAVLAYLLMDYKFLFE